MKANIKAILKRGFGILLFSGMLTACNDDKFFLLEDRNGLGSEVVWGSEGSINFHLNKTYELIIPKWPHQVIPNRWDIHLASDENYFASEEGHAARALGINGEALHNHDVFYVGNLYTLNYGSNRYFDIARCNNAIKFIPESTISDEAKRRFLGQYHAMRAMVYLELVKVYGGTTLVLEPQDPQNLEAKGRASARECFDVIVDDLTKAEDYLEGVTYTGDDWGRITQEAAASLKAKALLYWASPQFNPVNDPKHPYDASRWDEALEANKAAYDLCIAKGRSLMPEYGKIWQTKGRANSETIISRTYSSSLPKRGHNEERSNRPVSERGSPNRAYRATWKLLQAYPMKDGNRINQAGNYDYDAVMFWQNRDPRFTATFAYNGSSYPLSGKGESRIQWTYVGATVDGIAEDANWGVYTKKFTTPSLPAGNVAVTNDVGGSGMDWIEMRLAEVMLNYADCANETGDMGTAKNMVRTIRQRAGIEAGANDYGLGSVASIAEMRDLILNERMIEFAFENKRNSDLRRTRRWHLLSGESLETIRIELKDGVKADDLNGGDRDEINVEDKEDYEKNFRMSIQQQKTGFGAMNIPEYHNFYTFHNDYVWRGVDIYPTIGWAGGTFDPLDN
ncbi:RagB/SusD family nutrient uptake outer membrane protein [Sphingobacterium pedocola]|uniref:RagB/SusD family nutrient uptake outer membrane protein n=1 Tax=Sphingobacterium pedocola TaxID=2082722 RepID=A0ABR9T909_9SPHI|nr:RagB/SusD family nutrient uptake outer membrane protein [Sphingobacterium pedocola]MBE8721579.1 RagB/SusD family nutrient uptake outer membrane protein [Sphingobacterium pedocola]